MKTTLRCASLALVVLNVETCNILNPVGPNGKMRGLTVDTFSVSISFQLNDSAGSVLPYADYLLVFHFESCSGKIDSFGLCFEKSAFSSVESNPQLVPEGKRIQWERGFWGAESLTGVDDVNVYLGFRGSLWGTSAPNAKYLEDFAMKDSTTAQVIHNITNAGGHRNASSNP